MEHARYKPLSDVSALFQAAAGFAVAALVMLGVGGTIFKLVAPGGWLAQAFGRNLAGGLAAVLGLLIVGLCVWLTRNTVSTGGRNRYPEIFVYAFALAGAAYAVRFFAKGTP